MKITTIMTQTGPKQEVSLPLGGGELKTVVPLPDAELKKFPDIPMPTITENSLPRIPWNNENGSVIHLWEYFKKVWEKQQSEAFVWWHWDAETSSYWMIVPPYYTAARTGLNYTVSTDFCEECRVALFAFTTKCPHCQTGKIKKLCSVGTSHSHGSLTAFHSSEDHAHEMSATGFHITFGNIDHALPIAPSFVIAHAGQRFNTPWKHHFEFQQSDNWIRRLSLWLTLVSQFNSAIMQVTENNNVVFTGSQTACDLWMKSHITPRKWAVQPGTSVISSTTSIRLSPKVITAIPDTGPMTWDRTMWEREKQNKLRRAVAIQAPRTQSSDQEPDSDWLSFVREARTELQWVLIADLINQWTNYEFELPDFLDDEIVEEIRRIKSTTNYHYGFLDDITESSESELKFFRTISESEIYLPGQLEILVDDVISILEEAVAPQNNSDNSPDDFGFVSRRLN